MKRNKAVIGLGTKITISHKYFQYHWLHWVFSTGIKLSFVCINYIFRDSDASDTWSTIKHNEKGRETQAREKTQFVTTTRYICLL